MDDLPLSPRVRGSWGGVPDISAVVLDEREEVGRFLRTARPVHRGEALLVEDPIFLSPADDGELQVLLTTMCDSIAVDAAAANMPTPSASSSMSSPVGLSSSAGPTTAHWLPVPMQLSLVAVKALVYDPNSKECEALRLLAGDPERWSATASRLWSLLREDYRSRITQELVSEVYAIVAGNALEAPNGRAGLFLNGSYAEHSCIPTAFNEVILVPEIVSRPGSPIGSPMAGSSGGGLEASFFPPPMSPCATPMSPCATSSTAGRFQLVIRALHDLAEGDIVSISYIEEQLPTWKRRELLQVGYGFLCMCDRCECSPEVVCAFRCSAYCDGPCFPTAPLADGTFHGMQLRCEACDRIITEDALLEQYAACEYDEVCSAESSRLLHPYHHRMFRSYMQNIKAIPPHDRITAIEHLQNAQRRLTGGDGHPLLGQFCELIADAYVELSDQHRAASMYQRASDLYAVSYRGPPESGHDRRCYDQKMRVSVGRMGALPRRLSRLGGGALSRSPSLPSLAEGAAEIDDW